MNTRFFTKTIILLCFFATGATGLAYELIWTRMLILTFGSTQFAITTVLTTFMAGLALGSILLGRIIDRFPYPLIAYGLIELAIGIYCFLTPSIFEGIRSVYLSTFSLYEASNASFSPFQFSLSFAGIIIPATLMGGTLPILVKFFTELKDKVGLESGVLYSINTLGAVVGCFVTGSFLLYLLGVKETLYAAGSVDILVGMLVILLSYTMGARYQPAASSVESMQKARSKKQEARSKGQEITPVTSKIVLIAFALSGFAALAYEILWFRIFALVLGSSIYAFTIMLSTFLIGLAAGSAIFAGFIDKRKAPLLWFGILEVTIGISVLLSIFFYSELPLIFLNMSRSFYYRFWLFQLLQSVLCAMIMIVPTLCMGATFPTVSKIYTQSLKKVGKSIGNVYFFNTLGAIFGSFIAGFIFIPSIGVQKAIVLTTMLNIALGLTLLIISRVKFSTKACFAGLTMIILIVTIFNIPPWDRVVMTIGPYVNPESDIEMRNSKLIFYKDGVNATITVRKGIDGRTLTYQTNGKSEAKVIDSKPNEAWSILGHIPMLLNQDPKNALLIGLGSGITLGAMEQYPLNKIDVVEIEPAVVDAAGYFAGVNNDALNDSRVKLHLTDGRNFLMTSSKRYDVIISAVSDPWITGVANLFTREYFKEVEERLDEDGIVALWFQNYRISVDDLKTGLNTFASVFPHVSLWFHHKDPPDLIVIGSKKEHKFDLDSLYRKMSIETVRNDLARIDIKDPFDVFSLFLIGNVDLRQYLEEADINTDDKNILEFRLPKLLYYRSPFQGSRAQVVDFLNNAKDIFPVILPEDNREREALYYKLGTTYSSYPIRTDQAIRLFEKVLEISPENEGAKGYLEALR